MPGNVQSVSPAQGGGAQSGKPSFNENLKSRVACRCGASTEALDICPGKVSNLPAGFVGLQERVNGMKNENQEIAKKAADLDLKVNNIKNETKHLEEKIKALRWLLLAHQAAIVILMGSQFTRSCK